MKTPTKQQLRDKIANMEKLRQWDAQDIAAWRKRAKMAEFALWCSLATIGGIIILEFGL